MENKLKELIEYYEMLIEQNTNGINKIHNWHRRTQDETWMVSREILKKILSDLRDLQKIHNKQETK